LELADKWDIAQYDLKFLAALNAAGVDNWEGFDYARELMDD
jgi:hypothetical protein